jgi:hypothetical protein
MSIRRDMSMMYQLEDPDLVGFNLFVSPTAEVSHLPALPLNQWDKQGHVCPTGSTHCLMRPRGVYFRLS